MISEDHLHLPQIHSHVHSHVPRASTTLATPTNYASPLIYAADSVTATVIPSHRRCHSRPQTPYAVRQQYSSTHRISKVSPRNAVLLAANISALLAVLFLVLVFRDLVLVQQVALEEYIDDFTSVFFQEKKITTRLQIGPMNRCSLQQPPDGVTTLRLCARGWLLIVNRNAVLSTKGLPNGHSSPPQIQTSLRRGPTFDCGHRTADGLLMHLQIALKVTNRAMQQPPHTLSWGHGSIRDPPSR